MTRRMWIWSGALLLFAAIVLGTSVDSFVHWQPPADDPQQVLDFNQVVGFIVSGLLLVVVVTILVTGYRTAHGRRPYQRTSDTARTNRSDRTR